MSISSLTCSYSVQTVTSLEKTSWVWPICSLSIAVGSCSGDVRQMPSQDKVFIIIWTCYKLYINCLPQGQCFVHVAQVWSRKSIHQKVWHCCLFMHFSATLSINIRWNYCLIWFNISGLQCHLCDECSLQDALLWFCLKKLDKWAFWIHSINCSWSGPILSDVLNPLTQWGQEKTAAISQTIFSMHYLEWKCLNFD